MAQPQRIQILIHRLPGSDDLPLPRYMTAHASGMDVYAANREDIVIAPGASVIIPTGLAMALPEGYEAQIRPRSGLALKHSVTVLNTPGTIDADYRGEVGVILINHGRATFAVKRGERIAQMVIQRYVQAEWQTVEQLPASSRASGGFGSTGK